LQNSPKRFSSFCFTVLLPLPEEQMDIPTI
jgi:hypothetical protein